MAAFDDYKYRLAARIQFLREKEGLSLRKAGMMTGVHHNQIFAIEHARANPSLSTLCHLAEGFDVSLPALLSEEESVIDNPQYWFTKIAELDAEKAADDMQPHDASRAGERAGDAALTHRAVRHSTTRTEP